MEIEITSLLDLDQFALSHSIAEGGQNVGRETWQAEKPLFTFDGNLDDDEEARAFIDEHGTLRGRALANRLGFTGKGSAPAAGALSGYAWNKATACDCRRRGDITAAAVYESICDRIYSEDISGKINCW